MNTRSYRLISYSPGFIGREWIETLGVGMALTGIAGILPALLVGSGLKRSSLCTKYKQRGILPALLVGSGLKQTYDDQH